MGGSSGPEKLSDEVLVWFLSVARCRLFAYGPADAAASRNPIISLPFWYRLTQVVLEKRPLNGHNVVQLLLCEYSMPSMTAKSPLLTTNYYYYAPL